MTLGLIIYWALHGMLLLIAVAGLIMMGITLIDTIKDSH